MTQVILTGSSEVKTSRLWYCFEYPANALQPLPLDFNVVCVLFSLKYSTNLIKFNSYSSPKFWREKALKTKRCTYVPYCKQCCCLTVLKMVVRTSYQLSMQSRNHAYRSPVHMHWVASSFPDYHTCSNKAGGSLWH